MKHPPKVVFGATCPDIGYYVTSDVVHADGPFDTVEQAIDHLADMVCHNYTSPELMDQIVVVSDGTMLDIAKINGERINGRWVRANRPHRD